MIAAAECHGRITWHARPPAGTHPWDWFWAMRPAPALYLADLGPEWGNTRWTADGPIIRLHHDLTDVQRNVTLAHELHHIAAGGVCQRRCPRNEEKVVRATARWLLPDVAAVADSLRRRTVGSTAKSLGVCTVTIFERIEYMTAPERLVFDEAMRLGPDWEPSTRAARSTLDGAVTT